MPYLKFANFSRDMERIITGRNCSLLEELNNNGRRMQRRHFGVEVEACDYTRSCAEIDEWTADDAISALFDTVPDSEDMLFDYGEDCSLFGNCFELRTAPMTMKLLKALDWDAFFGTLKDNNYRQSDFNTCDRAGIHVHVNKASLKYPKESAINATLLVAENYELLRKFARRSRDEFERWAANPTWVRDSLDSAISKAYYGDYSEFADGFVNFPMYESRYRAINVTNNETYECRMFNSTLNGQDMIDILDFVDALWTVCDRPVYDMGMSDVLNYIKSVGNYHAYDKLTNPPEGKDVYYDWLDMYCEDEEEDEDDDW